MSHRILVAVLTLGTAVVGAIVAVEAALGASFFGASLAAINLATAAFLGLVVWPMVGGRPVRHPLGAVAARVAVLVMLAASGTAFWIEYLALTGRPGALAAAITWTLGAGVYLAGLLVPAPAAAKTPAPTATTA